MSFREKIIDKIGDFKALSTVALHLLQVTGDKDHALKDVVNIVENDPLLTARVLRIANTAAFSRNKEISTVSRALVNLGEKLVVGIAMESCAGLEFHKKLDGYESPEGAFWDHSLQSAIVSRELAFHAKKNPYNELAFTGALLHDIGKSVISEFLAGNSEKMANWVDSGKVHDYLHAERDVIETDHCEVGGELANHWHLPEPIKACIKFHHDPQNAPEEYRSLVYIVHLGDIVSMLGGVSTGADSLGYKLDSGYTEYLTLDNKIISEILLLSQEEFQITKKVIFSQGAHS